MRTFVFISDIPDFLLQPLQSGTAAESNASHAHARNANRDPRYERLRRLLADNSSGVMLVMHLETKGYGLALYASEEEALEACKATITPEQPNKQYAPLRLRIVEREQPPPPESVYHPTIRIDGVEVPKSTLATTRGLELCYRGKVVPRWCSHSVAEEDCPLGMACHRIHKKSCQRTVRKRPRIEDYDGADNNNNSSDTKDAQISRLLRSRALYEAALIPSDTHPSHSMRLLPAVYVTITLAEVRALLQLPPQASSNNTNQNRDKMMQELSARVQSAIDAHNSTSDTSESRLEAPYYIRLSCPGGSPWDWSLYDDNSDAASNGSSSRSSGLAELRRRCPMPARGTPTPLERDVLIQRLWYNMNEMNRFTSVPRALHALRTSARVKEAVMEYYEEQGRSAHKKHNSENDEEEEVTMQLCVQPWLRLPTVGCEVSAFIEQGGQRLRGLVQRYGQQRLMLPLTLLYHKQQEKNTTMNDDVLQRFALVGTDTDPTLEEAMTQEVHVLNKKFAHAANDVCRYLAKQSESGRLPSGAAWCAQLALVLPHEKESNDSINTILQDARIVVLSYKPYQRALEECPLYTSLTRTGQETTSSNSGGEVSWNLQHHHFVPLLDRSLLERLRPEA